MGMIIFFTVQDDGIVEQCWAMDYLWTEMGNPPKQFHGEYEYHVYQRFVGGYGTTKMGKFFNAESAVTYAVRNFGKETCNY